MRTIAIIQARLGSTRFPRKVLADLCGQPMLWHVLERVKRARCVQDIVLAIPQESESHLLEAIAIRCHVPVYRGDHLPAADIIGRYLGAAQASGAELIVRIGADNPCVQAEYIDAAIQTYWDHCVPYVNTASWSAVMHGGHRLSVDGLGAEVFSLSRLKWLDAKTKTEPAMREWPERIFARFIPPVPMAALRLDINTQDDYEFIRDLYEHVYPDHPQFTIEDILEVLDHEEVFHERTQAV